MPLPITSQADYQKGRFKLPFSSITSKDFDEYITEYEPKYLDDLLGCDLAALFIADLDADGVPQTAIYQTIYNKLCVDFCGQEYKSSGIKDMLTKFIWFEYSRDIEADNSDVGVQVSKGENQTKADFYASKGLKFYNEAVNNYLVIQYYICQNINDYPDYKGKTKDYIHSLI